MKRPQMQKHAVDHPALVQEPHPGVDAQQEGGPEGQDHHQEQDRAHRRPAAHNAISHRIADQQAEHGGYRRQFQRVEIGADIEVIFKQEGEILEGDRQLQRHLLAPLKQRGIGRLCDHRGRQADLQHDGEGHEEENKKPEERPSCAIYIYFVKGLT